MKPRFVHILAGAAIAAVSALTALFPQTASAGALHVFCVSPTATCLDNGTITPTSDPSPNFGFKASPNSGTFDDFDLVVLIPNSVSGAFAETINVTGTHVSHSLPVNLTLVSTTAWSSGQLDAFLGISASPTNPIGAFLPLTQAVAPTATGYAVYMFDFGSGKFSSTKDPTFTTLFDFPVGTVITAFAGKTSCEYVYNKKTCKWEKVCSTTWTATANSGSLLITKAPEPASFALMGAGLAGLGWKRRRKLV